jgi:hypothetical protein
MARDIADCNAKAGAMVVVAREKIEVIPTGLVAVDAFGCNVEAA